MLLSIYCYSLSGYPYPSTLSGVMEQLDAACEHWHIFASHAQPPHIIKAYDQKRWPEFFITELEEPTVVCDESSDLLILLFCSVQMFVWSFLYKTYGEDLPFDWIVKVDSDSFIRPSTFEKLFALHDPSKPVLLSMGGDSGYGDGVTADGYFIAWSHEASKRLFSTKDGSRKRNRRLQLCMSVLSGHNEDGDETEYKRLGITKRKRDPGICQELLGLQYAYPMVCVDVMIVLCC